MKSLLLLSSLLFLFSCGKEQFGTAAQQESSQADALKAFHQASCSSHTLIKPKVDILYVVDNSSSTYYLKDSIRDSIKNTVNSVSKEFDYRIIGIPLIPNQKNSPNSQFEVLTNSADPLPSGVYPLNSANEFFFYKWSPPANGQEYGLRRITDFMSAQSSLFRPEAYHLIVLISNGRDTEVEVAAFDNGQTKEAEPGIFNTRLAAFNDLKSQLQSIQLRMLSVTTSSSCANDNTGWLSSELSYRKMSESLYETSLATDSPIRKDKYDLCSTSDIRNIYTAVNNSIKKILIPHKYQYWPITFAENNERVSLDDIKVYKYTQGSVPVLMSPSEWSYHEHTTPGPLNTRIFPTPGEAVSGKHFIEFTTPLEYPSCVQVTSVSKTEYFGWVVLPRPAKPQSLVIRVNGVQIPSEAITYNPTPVTTPTNIKVQHKGSSLYPEVKKTGYFIKITNPAYYYKSGDNVEVNYTPDAI